MQELRQVKLIDVWNSKHCVILAKIISFKFTIFCFRYYVMIYYRSIVNYHL